MPRIVEASDYWLISGAYTKHQLEKIARTIIDNTNLYDSYNIDYSKDHRKSYAQLIFLKGPHLEFKCHHVIIKTKN